MGLFDFFRGTPTPEKFAEMFMKELRRGGVEGPITYEAAENRVLVGSGDDREVINLANFYKEYVALPRSQRRRHLAERARLVGPKREEVAEDFEEARRHLRPKLWVRSALELMRLQIRVDGGDPSKFDIPEYEVGSHLVASLVYDLPQTMQSVSTEQLQAWGVTYYEALEIARENLEEVPCSFAQIGDGCYAFATGDSYDSCRLLLPSLVERLKVKGDLIAVVPNRDELLITGSDDPQGLRIVAELAAAAREKPRPMVPLPLRRDGDDWVDWMPPPGHPAHPKFLELAREFFLEQYADQKRMLDQLHEQDGTDVFVASYALVKKKDGGQFTYAVWANGVRTLLPRAEWVMFPRAEDDLAAIAPWEKVEQVAGRLMRPTEHYPARWLVEEFPSDAELAELGVGEP